MSDLAPFVAAVLKDKVVADLLAEHARLQQLVSFGQNLALTGPQRFPVYATAQLNEGTGGVRWKVALQSLKRCPLSKLPQLELRLGSVLLERVQYAPCAILDFLEGCYDEETQQGLFELSFRDDSCVESMLVRVGPFPSFQDYEQVLEGDNLDIQNNTTNALEASSSSLSTEGVHLAAVAKRHPGMTIVFQEVCFHRLRVQGSLENVPYEEESQELLDKL